MLETLLAKRYAKALFELALEMKDLDGVKSDMVLVLDVINESKDFRLMLKSPVIKADKKAVIISKIFKGNVSNLSERFLVLVAKQRREPILLLIAKEFIDFYNIHNKIFITQLTTPVKITDDVRAKIINVLEKATEGTVELVEKINEDLLGGFVLNYKDKQYDASLQREINNLRREFNINLYVRGI